MAYLELQDNSYSRKISNLFVGAFTHATVCNHRRLMVYCIPKEEEELAFAKVAFDRIFLWNFSILQK
jgi:hypothetical protein